MADEEVIELKVLVKQLQTTLDRHCDHHFKQNLATAILAISILVSALT